MLLANEEEEEKEEGENAGKASVILHVEIVCVWDGIGIKISAKSLLRWWVREEEKKKRKKGKINEFLRGRLIYRRERTGRSFYAVTFNTARVIS